MREIRFLSLTAFLFGAATGLVNSAAPQAVIALKLSSFDLGLVGAGVPAGYALSCLVCGVVLSKVPLKRVQLCGIFGGALSLFWMASARTSLNLIAAQIIFGLFSGAFWPFCSAWLLDFESPAIPKSLILRHYNVAWTGGTALGMYSGGLICQQGWVFEAFYVSGSMALVALLVTLVTREAKAYHAEIVFEAGPESAPMTPSLTARVAFGALIAAAIFNLSAIGTKIIIAVNYAELNVLQGGGANRMGLFTAVAVLSQLAAFGLGKIYEPYLQARRLYVLGAVALIGTNFVFANSTSMLLLLPAVAATGFVMAVAFQAAMIAFTSRAKTARSGTALAETFVGVAGMMPLAAGFITDQMKSRGATAMDANRAPFYAAMMLISAALIAQLFLLRKKSS